MAIIRNSAKFEHDPGHYKAYTADETILFRIVRPEGESTYIVMTATAPEDDGSLAPYADAQRLMSTAVECFDGMHDGYVSKLDRNGLPYVEFRGLADPIEIERRIERVAERLGLPMTKMEWVAAGAQREMQDLREELSVSDDPDEEVYLSDGVSLRPNGSLVHR